MSASASIGPANMVPRNNVKPGISRLFPLRLALRIGEMLRAIKREGLPGVLKNDQVKTRGTDNWEGCGEVRRLLVPESRCDYGALAARSLKTMLEGSKGRAANKTEEDVTTVSQLRTTAPRLSDTFVQDLLADSRDAIANCNRRSKEGKKGKGRVRVADAGVAPSEIAIPEDIEQDHAADVTVAQSSVAAIDVQAERSASVLSLESTSTVVQSEGDGCDTDDTVSEVDSRSVATDDSWSG